jgi:hypothetical protein
MKLMKSSEKIDFGLRILNLSMRIQILIQHLKTGSGFCGLERVIPKKKCKLCQRGPFLKILQVELFQN